jgi:hypothetical protein
MSRDLGDLEEIAEQTDMHVNAKKDGRGYRFARKRRPTSRNTNRSSCAAIQAQHKMSKVNKIFARIGPAVIFQVGG